MRGETSPKTFEESHADCKLSGGHLVEIKDQNYTNAFLSHTIELQENLSGREKFWTGGLRNYIAGKKFDMWYESADMLHFDGISSDNPTNQVMHGDEDISYGITLIAGLNAP